MLHGGEVNFFTSIVNTSNSFRLFIRRLFINYLLNKNRYELEKVAGSGAIDGGVALMS